MSFFVRYLLLTAIFALLSSGVVVAAMLDTVPQSGSGILWMIVPVTFLFLIAAVINDKLLVPGLLLRHKYLAYVLSALAVAYLGAYASIWVEYWMRSAMGLSQRVDNYTNGWILIDTFCSGLLLMFILLGLGAEALYDKWKVETDNEKEYADSLHTYIREVRKRLSFKRILSSITHVTETLRFSTDDAIEEIQSLSAYLRSQLYELPAPPKPDFSENANDDLVESKPIVWLVDPRYRLSRHAIFLLVLPLLSFTVFFNAPDEPVFTRERFLSFISMFLLLDAIAYVNILWLFRRFHKSHNLRRYIVELVILILMVMAPAIISEIVTYDINVIDKGLPPLIIALSLLGSLVTLFLFVGGTSALMLLKDWISGQRRMTMLRAETARQEYAYLRKQINPHFLFNVLNNAGILIEEDPDEAVQMLSTLRRLLEFQFDQTERSSTTVGQEMLFLRTYLNLEATRIDYLDFSINAASSLDNLHIPTLLFIPFVENAVKYSSVINGHRMVSLNVADRDGKLIFRCENTFNTNNKSNNKSRSGGLGLANTRRRLDLLFNSDYSLRQEQTPESFVTTLIFPYDYEMHNN